MLKTGKGFRRLTDAYAFWGFRPCARVCGVFGDPKARIVTLVRRAKKQSAACVERRDEDGTTGARGAFATCRAATRGCTSRSRYGVFSADAVVR